MANRIADDVPPLKPFSEDTLTKVFFHAIDHRSRSDAMRYKEGGSWKSVSHQEAEIRVSRLAAALSSWGIERRDRVAMLSENRPEWAITDFAALGLGCIDVPVYPTLPANQVAYILNDCEAKVILVSTAEQLNKILEIRDEVPSLKRIVSFEDPRGAPGVLSFSDVLEEGRRLIDAGSGESFRERALQVKPEDVATLIYTSGTTGNPKGVMLTHGNLASNLAAVSQHGVIEFQKGDVALSFLPLSHVFERLVDYYYWLFGVSIAYAESIDKVADNLTEVQPHYMVSVPRLFEKIYAKVMGATGVKRKLVMWAKAVGEEAAELELAGKPVAGGLAFKRRIADKLVFSKLRDRTGGRLRAAISGGAPLSGDVAKFFFAAGLPVYEGYGLTETSPVLCANRPGFVRLGTVGQPVPGTEVRIDTNGEILARGPQIMKGYWKQDSETTAVIDGEGWFHTGDVGEFDTDGFLRITDRIKNILVTAGGKNIAPQPIENEVAMSPYIAQVVMLGDKRAYPTLLLVPDFENLKPWAQERGIDTGDHERLSQHPDVRELLEKEAFKRLDDFARYEVPKKIAVIPSEFSIETGELTPTLKVKRRVVEDHYSSVIEEMYSEA
ncbi:AMP-dependent synthetase/ligase [soil metagenome]